MPTPSARLEAQLPGHPADQAIRRLACRETLDKLGFDRAEPGCVDYPLLACHPATSLAQPGMGGLDDRLAHATCDDREGLVLKARHISELLLSFSAPPLGRRPTKGIREVHGRQFAAEEAASPDFSQRNVARNSCDEVLAPIHGEPAHRSLDSKRIDRFKVPEVEVDALAVHFHPSAAVHHRRRPAAGLPDGARPPERPNLISVEGAPVVDRQVPIGSFRGGSGGPGAAELDRSHTGQRGQTVGDGLDEWIRHHHTVPDPTLGVEVTWRTHPNDDEMRGEGPGRGRGQAGCRSGGAVSSPHEAFARQEALVRPRRGANGAVRGTVVGARGLQVRRS
jgi:hypothetical protein